MTTIGVRPVDIGLIIMDKSAQCRMKLDSDALLEYQHLWSSNPRGYPFDKPCVVFFDGHEHYLSDGFHRVTAASMAGRTAILCDVRQGTLQDAIKASATLNGRHGLRLSPEDRRHYVDKLLSNPDLRYLSLREVARLAGVSHPTVGVRLAHLQEYLPDGHPRKEEVPQEATELPEPETSEELPVPRLILPDDERLEPRDELSPVNPGSAGKKPNSERNTVEVQFEHLHRHFGSLKRSVDIISDSRGGVGPYARRIQQMLNEVWQVIREWKAQSPNKK